MEHGHSVITGCLIFDCLRALHIHSIKSGSSYVCHSDIDTLHGFLIGLSCSAVNLCQCDSCATGTVDSISRPGGWYQLGKGRHGSILCKQQVIIILDDPNNHVIVILWRKSLITGYHIQVYIMHSVIIDTESSGSTVFKVLRAIHYYIVVPNVGHYFTSDGL